MFDISVESVCHVIAQARALALGGDADGEEHEPDAHGHEDLLHGDTDDDDLLDGDDVGGEDDVDALTDDHDELVDFIDGLNDDEQIELTVISWVGRGTYTVDEWEDAAETARLDHSGNTAEYLLGQPRIADYLEEGLSQLGFSCEG
ncbi:MAG: DUF3775 domain-containing protein [Alphaproteobacteria bacterium]|nr:DUF3775 domain-containing protein [Alphaproteobacteria bacterium]